MPVVPVFGEHTIDQMILMFRSRQINLDPGFQRRSVWSWNDRRRLMQSIVAGYPLPSIFLYQRTHKGRLVYDVIDGKQRLETIYMFTRTGRFKKSWFDVKLDLGNGTDWHDWNSIARVARDHPERGADIRAAIRSYKLQTVEVTGDLAQIIDLFVRINSTGKRLTSGEKRHARFYDSLFLREADHLALRFKKFLLSQKIISPAQFDRMKGTELFAELLMSIQVGGLINKKTSLDRAIGNDSVNRNSLKRLVKEFVSTLNLVKKMFPELRQTRLRNSADFYSLFMLIWQMNSENLVLKDRRRNSAAFELLRKLSTGVDQLRQQLKRAVTGKPAQRLYQEYLLTVQGDTDSSANRERRAAVLRNLLHSLFERKDDKRLFTSEQRRIIWNSEEKKVCAKCEKPVAWDGFTVDHILAYARGGKTELRNAQLMHRDCNASKGIRLIAR